MNIDMFNRFNPFFKKYMAITLKHMQILQYTAPALSTTRKSEKTKNTVTSSSKSVAESAPFKKN